MINQELNNYVKQQLESGVDKEKIKKDLILNGWQSSDVEESFNLVQKNNNTSQFQQEATLNSDSSSLPSATEILKQAWAIYKNKFTIFLGVTIIPVLFFAIFSFLLKQKSSILISLFLILLIFLVQIWWQLAVIYIIKDPEEKIGIFEVYRRSWSKLFSYFWVVVLSTFILLGGYFLFIVPGIIFSVWFSFAVFILAQENLKGMDALLKSREYVRNKWGEVLGRLFLVGLLFSVPFLLLNGLVALLKIPFGNEIINFIINLFAPILIASFFIIYKKLKTIKGEFDFKPTTKKKIGFILVGI